MWSDVHSVKRALRSLSKKFTPEELEEKKAELRRREKDGLFSLVFMRIRSTRVILVSPKFYCLDFFCRLYLHNFRLLQEKERRFC